MSNFPYNNHKANDSVEFNGSPLPFATMLEWARAIYDWHNMHNQTDLWTQSNDGAERDIHNLTWGLIEMLSDPGALRRLMMTGENVADTFKTLQEIQDEKYRTPYTAVCAYKAVIESLNP